MSGDGENPVGACLNGVSRGVQRALSACLDGGELSCEDAALLSEARGKDLLALCVVADTMRERQAGDDVSYVVNRNINFTNVCVKTCQFCAFSRDLRSEEGYLLDSAEIVRRALEAQEVGATEVCLQAGLPPTLRGRLYIDLCETLKRAAPDLHLHAFSPEEVKYGATRAKMSTRDYLEALRDAGLGSLPGTSAEILDDSLRHRISPGRISTSEWVEVIRTAHDLGLPTTSTMMFGHVETIAQRVAHMDLLRSIQKETGGFTEFVPLSFVHHEAPMFIRGTQPGVSPGPTGDDVIRLYAIARLMLGPTFRNIQASWVKEGPRVAQWLLSCGVNDLGGTLINESISTSAGAGHGQLMTPATLRRLIRDAGRVPVQRNTRYEILRRFDGPAESDPVEALDRVTDPERFGSYRALVADPRFRYEDTSRPE
ncbi:MAG: 5-amino-6-(D-ribitylamino)uracil--L-tyrosine 4-hydroxyphenyl transferase CofH [Myxococcota bacterium]